MSPDDLIRRLGLMPHPEGGHYAETHRAEASEGARSAVTSIYYLLCAGERSHWHRIDATEIWHYQAGAALSLDIALATERFQHRIGPDLLGDDTGHAVVPPSAWQQARPLGPWSLVSCTVAPGFVFDRFELAPADFEP